MKFTDTEKEFIVKVVALFNEYNLLAIYDMNDESFSIAEFEEKLLINEILEETNDDDD